MGYNARLTARDPQRWCAYLYSSEQNKQPRQRETRLIWSVELAKRCEQLPNQKWHFWNLAKRKEVSLKFERRQTDNLCVCGWGCSYAIFIKQYLSNASLFSQLAAKWSILSTKSGVSLSTGDPQQQPPVAQALLFCRLDARRQETANTRQPWLLSKFPAESTNVFGVVVGGRRGLLLW